MRSDLVEHLAPAAARGFDEGTARKPHAMRARSDGAEKTVERSLGDERRNEAELDGP
jgi:hypothetical protein